MHRHFILTTGPDVRITSRKKLLMKYSLTSHMNTSAHLKLLSKKENYKKNKIPLSLFSFHFRFFVLVAKMCLPSKMYLRAGKTLFLSLNVPYRFFIKRRS